MAGPLSGIIGQQQPSYTTTFRPGGTQQEFAAQEQQKQDDASQKAASGQTRTQGAESTSAPASQGAQSNATQDRNTQQSVSFGSNDNDGDDGSTARRGSILDIAV